MNSPASITKVTTKPRLSLVHGRWTCGMRAHHDAPWYLAGFFGVGESPIQAYQSWQMSAWHASFEKPGFRPVGKPDAA